MAAALLLLLELALAAALVEEVHRRLRLALRQLLVLLALLRTALQAPVLRQVHQVLLLQLRLLLLLTGLGQAHSGRSGNAHGRGSHPRVHQLLLQEEGQGQG